MREPGSCMMKRRGPLKYADGCQWQGRREGKQRQDGKAPGRHRESVEVRSAVCGLAPAPEGHGPGLPPHAAGSMRRPPPGACRHGLVPTRSDSRIARHPSGPEIFSRHRESSRRPLGKGRQPRVPRIGSASRTFALLQTRNEVCVRYHKKLSCGLARATKVKKCELVHSSIDCNNSVTTARERMGVASRYPVGFRPEWTGSP